MRGVSVCYLAVRYASGESVEVLCVSVSCERRVAQQDARKVLLVNRRRAMTELCKLHLQHLRLQVLHEPSHTHTHTSDIFVSISSTSVCRFSMNLATHTHTHTHIRYTCLHLQHLHLQVLHETSHTHQIYLSSLPDLHVFSHELAK